MAQEVDYGSFARESGGKEGGMEELREEVNKREEVSEEVSERVSERGRTSAEFNHGAEKAGSAAPCVVCNLDPCQ